MFVCARFVIGAQSATITTVHHPWGGESYARATCIISSVSRRFPRLRRGGGNSLGVLTPRLEDGEAKHTIVIFQNGHIRLVFSEEIAQSTHSITL